MFVQLVSTALKIPIAGLNQPLTGHLQVNPILTMSVCTIM